jgi:PAS domain S-box-containing protein
MLLGSFVTTSQLARSAERRNWLLGVYRSKPLLHASELDPGTFGTLILVCGLAMPLSLLLMYWTYQLAQRDQVRAEAAKARLAAIVQSSEDAIFSHSIDGAITSWNRGAERLFGYTEEEALGRAGRELIPPERAGEERQIVEQVLRGQQGEHTLETIRQCKGGRLVHVSQTLSAIESADGRPIGVSVIARDITDRKNLEREVLESAGREQQRIGRELHDSLGQELTGLSYLAKSLSQKLATGSSTHAETAQTITSGIQRALREVRSAVQGLVPVEVDASGFMIALEKLASETRSRCGIECRIESRTPVEIGDNVLATNLYRIVQEAINNAVKHAQARQIVVRPESLGGTLVVTVADDGVGIPEAAAANGGMGLRIMRYRANVIDATLDVQTTQGRGTAVVCALKAPGEPTP